MDARIRFFLITLGLDIVFIQAACVRQEAQLEPLAHQVRLDEKADQTILDIAAAFDKEGREEVVKYSVQHSLDLDEGLIPVVMVVPESEQSVVRARIADLGGKPVTQLTKYLYARLPAHALRVIGELPAVRRIAFDHKDIERLTPSKQ